jgi:putative FmdB family regulatory protein
VPIYDYVCTTCGHGVEVIHSVNGHGPAACPKCGGQMRKAIVAAAVHFKGSGWARKDRGAARPSRSSFGESSPPSADAPTDAASPKESSGSAVGTAGETSPKDAD